MKWVGKADSKSVFTIETFMIKAKSQLNSQAPFEKTEKAEEKNRGRGDNLGRGRGASEKEEDPPRNTGQAP